MDVTQVSTTGQNSGNSAAQAQTDLASDFDTFLQLLTAQIENQDPLNPADSTEFATQLATFSNVEQGVRTNTLLENLLAQFEVQGLDQVASWIGMEVRTTGATSYQGGEVTLELQSSSFASAADLVINDETGVEVGRLPVDPAASQVSLIPRGFDGQELPVGRYSYSLEPVGPNGPMTPSEAARYVKVQEALIENGSPVLVTTDGDQIETVSVTGLRPV